MDGRYLRLRQEIVHMRAEMSEIIEALKEKTMLMNLLLVDQVLGKKLTEPAMVMVYPDFGKRHGIFHRDLLSTQRGFTKH